MEDMRNHNPEQLEFGDYSVFQILQIFTHEEILDIHDYYLDHIGAPEILFGQPLPPGFAPDKVIFYPMLTDNRLSERSPEAVRQYHKDLAIQAIKRSMPKDRDGKLKAQRALRTCNVAIACLVPFEQEAREAATEQREPETA